MEYESTFALTESQELATHFLTRKDAMEYIDAVRDLNKASQFLSALSIVERTLDAIH